MKSKYANANDIKRINKLLEDGYKLYKAFKEKGDYIVTLVFVKE